MANKTVYPFGTGGQLPSSIGIINDLTTGGADKALSAEMGKVLSQSIQELDTGFISISSNEIQTKTIDRSGNITTNTGYWMKVIPVSKDEVVVFNASASVSTAALSFSTDADATTVTVLMMHNANGGYYWGKAPNDGYMYMVFTHDTAASYKIVKSEPYDLVGVRHIDKGTNVISELVGSEYADTKLWGNGFLSTTGSITSGSGYKYSKKYYPVAPGNYFQRFSFSSNAKIVVYDKDYSVLTYKSSGNATDTKMYSLPDGAAYIRISVATSATPNTSTLTFVSQQDSGYYLDEGENEEIVETIDNNLISEGEYLDSKRWAIYDDGVINPQSYGKDNVCYRYALPDYTKKLHIKFEFQFTRALAAGSTVDQPICRLYGLNYYSALFRQRGYEYVSASGYASRGSDFCVSVGSSVTALNLNYVNYKTNEGEVAFTLQLKQATTDNILLFLSSTAITIKLDDTTLETITAALTDDLNDVIDRINASNYLSATPYFTTGKTWADVNKGNTNGIPIATLALVPINLSHDESWHTFEAIIDLENLTSVTAFDGITISKTIVYPSELTLYLGGKVGTGITSYRYTPVRFRNLHIAINSFEDAEEVSLLNVTDNNYTKQLISNINPKVIVFEGHGIEVRRDTDTIGNEMSVSTDRLRRVFTHAIAKGYVPITFKQFRDWKIRGIQLPAKRCFTLMMDDFRIENYMEFAKRLPFEQYGVKPALAIISDRQRSEEVTINGTAYTIGEIFDILNRADWYCCSHTYNHTNLGDVPNAEMMSYLHQCITSAQKLGIHDDVLVYPRGSRRTSTLWQIPLSDFALGINIAVNGYICKGSNNYNIIRNEIGHGGESDTEKILERIV